MTRNDLRWLLSAEFICELIKINIEILKNKCYNAY